MTVSSGKEIEYYAYIPDDLSFGSRDSVPLLMWFHGGGGEAEAMVSWTEWPLVAKENGFMVVSFDQHGSYTSMRWWKSWICSWPSIPSWTRAASMPAASPWAAARPGTWASSTGTVWPA